MLLFLLLELDTDILVFLQDVVWPGHAEDGGAGEGAVSLPDYRRGAGERGWLPGGGRA